MLLRPVHLLEERALRHVRQDLGDGPRLGQAPRDALAVLGRERFHKLALRHAAALFAEDARDPPRARARLPRLPGPLRAREVVFSAHLCVFVSIEAVEARTRHSKDAIDARAK